VSVLEGLVRIGSRVGYASGLGGEQYRRSRCGRPDREAVSSKAHDVSSATRDEVADRTYSEARRTQALCASRGLDGM
jgi:hypothetical protein